jgi:hypothetical protein
MVTADGLRLCSAAAGAPLAMLEFTMAGPLMMGTVGWTGVLPFTGEMELDIAFCVEEPACACAGGVFVGTAVGETGFPFVALAYEERAAEGVVPVAAVGEAVPADCGAGLEFEMVLAGLVIR